MTIEFILLAAGLALYGIATAVAITTLVSPTESKQKPALALMTVGGVPFLILLIRQGLGADQIPAYGEFEVLVCYCLAVVAAYIHISLKNNMKAVSSLLIPYITVMLSIASFHFGDARPEPPNVNWVWLNIHIVSAFAGYGFFTVASVLASAYLVQDHNLKHKKLGRIFQRLPDLETLDTLMYRQVGFAFLLFTISIVAGIRLSHMTGKHAEWMTDPKTAATAVTWLLYAALMHLRLFARQHGRKIALATVFGLACVLFTFIGIHIISESIHNFILRN